MYNTILLPTDGSKGAQRGIDHALDLAGEHGASLHALFVVEERIHGTTPALSSEELYLEAVERDAERFLDEVVVLGRERGVDVTPVCVRGDPCTVIPNYARERGMDLIVMGHHGVGSERRPHFRACVDEVSGTSDVPVVAV